MQIEILGFILLLIVLNMFLGLFKKKNNLAYCGLVGFSGTGNFDIIKIKFLLYWNSIERNSVDSTGVYTPATQLIKNNIRAEFFLTDDKFIDKVVPDNVLVGHVRAKTFGHNTLKNAHPFEYDTIVGAHNGTLKNHLKLAYQYGIDYDKFDVDSQALFMCMEQDWSDATNRFSILSKYEGAAALLVFDKKENVLYACHDNERTLAYGYINKTEMYISSDKSVLTVIGCEDINDFPINTIHKIKNGKIVATGKYNPYKAPISVTPKIAGTTDFTTIYKGNKPGKIKFKEGDIYRGFSYHAAYASMLEGYWVQVDSHLAKDMPTLEKNNWYYVVDIDKGATSATDKLVLIGEDDKNISVGVNYVDTKNFIPVPGQYVKLMCDLTSRKNPKLTLAKQDDICLVKKYTYGEDIIEIKNLETNRTITAHVSACRVLSYAENEKCIANKKAISDLLKATAENEKAAEDFVKGLLESPAEAPFIETPTGPVEETLVDIDEAPIDKQAETETYIPYSMFLDILDGFRTKLEEISVYNTNSHNTAVGEGVDELLDIIGKSYDVNEVEKFIQE